jgi:hypothetical protein
MAAAALFLGAAAAGCPAERGDVYDCTCTFLTDFDDPSRHEVLVCAPSSERAPAIARGCAQAGAPAPVQGCACRKAAAGTCALGECRMK